MQTMNSDVNVSDSVKVINETILRVVEMAKRKNSKKSDVPKLSLIDLKSKEIQADDISDSCALPVTSPATEIKTASVRFDGQLLSDDETEYETLSDNDDFDGKAHYYDFKNINQTQRKWI